MCIFLQRQWWGLRCRLVPHTEASWLFHLPRLGTPRCCHKSCFLGRSCCIHLLATRRSWRSQCVHALRLGILSRTSCLGKSTTEYPSYSSTQEGHGLRGRIPRSFERLLQRGRQLLESRHACSRLRIRMSGRCLQLSSQRWARLATEGAAGEKARAEAKIPKHPENCAPSTFVLSLLLPARHRIWCIHIRCKSAHVSSESR